MKLPCCYLSQDNLKLNHLHYLHHIVLLKFLSMSFQFHQDGHFQVSSLPILEFYEMVLHYLTNLAFQFLQSHHPTKPAFLMKWQELVHEGEMVLQKEIPEFDPRQGSTLQDVEYHCHIRNIFFDGQIYLGDQVAAQQSCHLQNIQGKLHLLEE